MKLEVVLTRGAVLLKDVSPTEASAFETWINGSTPTYQWSQTEIDSPSELNSSLSRVYYKRTYKLHRSAIEGYTIEERIAVPK
ncbi:hypothetical protein ACQKNO_01330 [Bacillus paramycoides]|uniref:hypothetical protein n=1 Tax=Bacillus paramycoides TaxID=2026194 RepID=UPI003D0332F1